MELLPIGIAFIIGAVFGAGIYKLLTANASKTESLAQQLDQVHSEYVAYQESVDQHFTKTADLINNLTQSYAEVHQHLAKGARTLTQSTNSLAQSDPNLKFDWLSNSFALDDNQATSTFNDKESTIENTEEARLDIEQLLANKLTLESTDSDEPHSSNSHTAQDEKLTNQNAKEITHNKKGTLAEDSKKEKAQESVV